MRAAYPPHDPKKLEMATQAWNEGATWTEVAERFGFVSMEAAMMAVRMNAKRKGLTLRFANGANDEARRARSAELYKQGMSLSDIAIECGWSDGGAAQSGIRRYERAQLLKKRGAGG